MMRFAPAKPLLLVLAAAVAATTLALACEGGDAKAPLLVGLRRSSYGLPAERANHAWWADRARQYAADFNNVQPAILEIISTYQDNGGTQLEFARPADDKGPTARMTFASEGIDHDKALAEYDRRVVKAILQLEPGEADVGRCFELAWAKFKGHPCLAGFAVDAEWYFTAKSKDKSGLQIPDAEARKWMEQVLAWNPEFVLVLKHWDPKHLPPTYRHPHLWFLSDSQDFKTQREWQADMAAWSKAFKDSAVGFQFGYPKDRPWWSKSARPPADLGKALVEAAPNCRMLLWVDFTADKVEFK